MVKEDRAALEMLEAFAGVGARAFDITLTDAAGHKIAFRPGRSLDQLRPALSDMLKGAAEQQHNIIVRPRSGGTALVQLDDLDERATSRLRPVSFLVLRTSPGNFQTWLAVSDSDADFARRLRRGAGADLGASGACRIAGSLNVKEKHAPKFPRMATVHTNPGLIVARAELEALGIVAPAEPQAPVLAPARVSRPSSARPWPSYQRCLENAPQARGSGRPDVSRADFTWCLIALDWNFCVEETAARLMDESRKAQENGEAYALRTARAAAAAFERRRGRQR
jgi:hypothetical protein